METEELTIGRVHHGRNIRRTRIEKNMNQEGLSELVHLSQPAVSKYEKMKVIDDEMLQRFARALNVPFDYLKTLEEDAQTVVFENNTVNNSEQSAGGANIRMQPQMLILDLLMKLVRTIELTISILSTKSLNSTSVF